MKDVVSSDFFALIKKLVSQGENSMCKMVTLSKLFILATSNSNFFLLKGWYLADFRGVEEFKIWSYLESLFVELSFAPKIGCLPQLGTEPRPFEIFQRKWGFFNFGHSLIMLVSNCMY